MLFFTTDVLLMVSVKSLYIALRFFFSKMCLVNLAFNDLLACEIPILGGSKTVHAHGVTLVIL